MSFITAGQASQSKVKERAETLLEQKAFLPLAVEKPSEELSVIYAFQGVLSSAKIPGGVVAIPNCYGEEKFRIEPTDPSLRSTLNAICSASGKYEWKIEDGVINLSPTVWFPDLLEVQIKEFQVENASIEFMLGKLEERAEIRERARKLGFDNDQLKLIVGGVSRGLFTVSCKNTTVREVLNAIVREQGRAVWLYKEFHCNGKNYYNFDFIVV